MHGYSMGYPWVVGQLPWAGNGYYIGTHGPIGIGNGQRPLCIGYPYRGLVPRLTVGWEFGIPGGVLSRPTGR